MTNLKNQSRFAQRWIIAISLTMAFSPTFGQVFNIKSITKINTTVTLTDNQRALIIPNQSSVWNVWGKNGRALGYGGLQGTKGHGRPAYPSPNDWQGALILYVNNKIRHVFLPTERSVIIVGPGIIGFGPNDNILSDNTGSIQVTIIINPTDAEITANAAHSI